MTLLQPLRTLTAARVRALILECSSCALTRAVLHRGSYRTLSPTISPTIHCASFSRLWLRDTAPHSPALVLRMCSRSTARPAPRRGGAPSSHTSPHMLSPALARPCSPSNTISDILVRRPAHGWMSVPGSTSLIVRSGATRTTMQHGSAVVRSDRVGQYAGSSLPSYMQ